MPEAIESLGPTHQEVRAVMSRINQAWLEGRPRDLGSALHADVVMRYPGFGGLAAGRQTLVGGFVDFCESAKVHAFEENDQQIDVIGSTAVLSYHFRMTYERDGQCFSSSGRDLWAFQREGSRWLAVWRTMLDLTEEAVAE